MRPTDFDAQLVALMPSLRKYALSRVRNWTAAEELVQATAVRALACWRQFQPGTNMRAWLCRILTNVHLDVLRRARPALPLDEVCDAVTAAVRADDALFAKEVGAAVLRLPRHLRHAVNRVCIDGLQYDEAAAEIGAEVGTIKSRVNRARALLQTVTS